MRIPQPERAAHRVDLQLPRTNRVGLDVTGKFADGFGLTPGEESALAGKLKENLNKSARDFQQKPDERHKPSVHFEVKGVPNEHQQLMRRLINTAVKGSDVSNLEHSVSFE